MTCPARPDVGTEREPPGQASCPAGEVLDMHALQWAWPTRQVDCPKAAINSNESCSQTSDCPASSTMSWGTPSKVSHRTPVTQVTRRPRGLATRANEEPSRVPRRAAPSAWPDTNLPNLANQSDRSETRAWRVVAAMFLSALLVGPARVDACAVSPMLERAKLRAVPLLAGAV